MGNKQSAVGIKNDIIEYSSKNKTTDVYRLLFAASEMIKKQKITNNSNCDNIMILTEKLLSNLNYATLKALAQATTGVANESGNKTIERIDKSFVETVMFGNKEEFFKLNEPGQFNKKQRLCKALSNLYSMINDIYVTCMSAINPIVFTKNKDGVISGKGLDSNELVDILFNNKNDPRKLETLERIEYNNFMIKLLDYFKVVESKNENGDDDVIIFTKLCSLQSGPQSGKSLTDFSAFKALRRLYADYSLDSSVQKPTLINGTDDDREDEKQHARKMAKSLNPNISSEALERIISLSDVKLLFISPEKYNELCNNENGIFMNKYKRVSLDNYNNKAAFDAIRKKIKELQSNSKVGIDKFFGYINQLFEDVTINVRDSSGKIKSVTKGRIKHFDDISKLEKLRKEVRKAAIEHYSKNIIAYNELLDLFYNFVTQSRPTINVDGKNILADVSGKVTTEEPKPVMPVEEHKPVMPVEEHKPVMHVEEHKPVMHVEEHKPVMHVEEHKPMEGHAVPVRVEKLMEGHSVPVEEHKPLEGHAVPVRVEKLMEGHAVPVRVEKLMEGHAMPVEEHKPEPAMPVKEEKPESKLLEGPIISL
jgi:hypothetical protein